MAARDWLAYFGDHDVRLGSGVADEGVDVESDSSVVQVKAGDTPTGRPVIQQIFGIAALEKKTGMVFSVSPFTDEAVEWAERAGVALFQMDLAAGARAVNQRARRVLESAGGRMTGWRAVRAELEALAAAGKEASITALFELPSGYRGHWGIWLDRAGGVRVVRDFSGGSVKTVTSPAAAVEHVAGGLRRIGGGFWDCRPMITVDGEERRFRPRQWYPEPASARPEHGVASAPPSVRVTASDVYKIAGNPWCERRLYLDTHGVEGEPPSALGMLLIEAGVEREEAHLAELDGVIDLSKGSLIDRADATVVQARGAAKVIYQGVLRTVESIGGCQVELVGIPDFLIRYGAGYVVRDTKTALRVEPSERPDIAAQLSFYGYLYERILDQPPVRLEVVTGDGSIVEIASEEPDRLEALITRVTDAKTTNDEPACLVKWSNRGTCPHFARCWEDAVGRGDVVTVPGVTRRLARRLHGDGTGTIGGLLQRHTEASLAQVTIRHGDRTVRVGARADDILRAARAICENRPIQHGSLGLPPDDVIVLFDLEGVPRFGSSNGGIYLWGTKVAGASDEPYEPVFAGAGPDGDRTGWDRFLQRASELLDTHGDRLPFVHWASYERSQLGEYLDRYGDRGGVGAAVLGNLMDLLQAVRDGITLPVRSYSLKVVEAYVGFRRSQTEFGGDWSIAMWQEALVASPERRDELLTELATYNEEDLLGMWAVYRWLRDTRAM